MSEGTPKPVLPLKVVKILCHVECTCSKCGGPAIHFGLAGILADGRIGVADPVPDDVVCNGCRRKESDEENAAYNKARAQRRWQKKAAAKVFFPKASLS